MSQRFVKNSFFGTLSAIAATLGSFLSGVLIARIGGVDGIGTYSFSLWIISVVTTITAVGLPLTLTRYLPEIAEIDQGSKARQLAAFILKPVLALSSAPLVVALIYGEWLWMRHTGGTARTGLAGDGVLCVLVGLSCTVQGLADFVKAYLRGTHRLDLVALLTSIGVVGQLIVIAIGMTAFGIRGAMIGYVIGVLIPALPLVKFIGVKGVAEPEMRRRIMRYARFRWISEIAAAFVFSRIEILFLQMLWGVDSVGLLTVGLTLANLAVQGPLMLTWGLLPHFSEQFSRNDKEGMHAAYAAGTRVIGFLIFPACFGLAAITPVLLPLIFGASFAPAVPSATVLVCAASVSATATVGANLLWAMERSDVDLYLSLIGAAVSIVGGFVLIALFGVTGAALSRAITQFTTIGAGTWFIARRLGFEIPGVALAKLLCSALLCALAAHLCLLLLTGWAGLALAVPVAAVVYFAAVRLCKGLTRDDISRLGKLMQHLPMPLSPLAQRAMLLVLG